MDNDGIVPDSATGFFLLSIAVGADCARPAPASVIAQPPDLRSSHGALDANLRFETAVDADGQTLYLLRGRSRVRIAHAARLSR